MGSGKGDPVLQKGNIAWHDWRQTISRVLIASTISIAFFQARGAEAQSADSKKPGLEPVAATSPGAKSAMSDGSSRQQPAANLPKPESAKGGAKGSDILKPASTAPAAVAAADSPASDKSTLPFPVVNADSISTLQGVQSASSRVFPSAVDIRGSVAGALLSASKETRFDMLSPLSIWLEEGPLLVCVRHPSEMVLVATKFGDIIVTTGGDALVERGEEDTLRIVNISTNSDTVFLNMHDKLWTNSPWVHTVKQSSSSNEKNPKGSKNSRKRTYEDVDSGAVSISPGYELVVGARSLNIDDVKPPDSIGRRDFKTIEGGRFVVDELNVDNLTQLHDLIKGLNDHGPKAKGVLSEIMKNAGQLKSKQGESGFEKRVPAPVKVPERKPKTPPKAPPPVKKTTTTPPASTAPAATTSTPPPAAPAK